MECAKQGLMQIPVPYFVEICSLVLKKSE